MIIFSYEDKLKLQEHLTRVGFLYIQNFEANTLEAKIVRDKSCYFDENTFYHKLYEVLSFTPNVADLKFSIDHTNKVVTFTDVIFPEDHFISYCMTIAHESFEGKLAFYFSLDLYKVLEKYRKLMGEDLKGYLSADCDNSVLFVTEYDYFGKQNLVELSDG